MDINEFEMENTSDIKLKKTKWTSEEDNILYGGVVKNGPFNWACIAEDLPGRSAKQCRERWHNHMNSGLRKGQWTKDEDKVIIQYQESLGNQWSKITKLLPGRSDNDVKNRFHVLQRAIKRGKLTVVRSMADDVNPNPCPSETGLRHVSSSGCHSVVLDLKSTPRMTSRNLKKLKALIRRDASAAQLEVLASAAAAAANTGGDEMNVTTFSASKIRKQDITSDRREKGEDAPFQSRAGHKEEEDGECECESQCGGDGSMLSGCTVTCAESLEDDLDDLSSLVYISVSQESHGQCSQHSILQQQQHLHGNHLRSPSTPAAGAGAPKAMSNSSTQPTLSVVSPAATASAHSGGSSASVSLSSDDMSSLVYVSCACAPAVTPNPLAIASTSAQKSSNREVPSPSFALLASAAASVTVADPYQSSRRGGNCDTSGGVSASGLGHLLPPPAAASAVNNTTTAVSHPGPPSQRRHCFEASQLSALTPAGSLLLHMPRPKFRASAAPAAGVVECASPRNRSDHPETPHERQSQPRLLAPKPVLAAESYSYVMSVDQLPLSQTQTHPSPATHPQGAALPLSYVRQKFKAYHTPSPGLDQDFLNFLATSVVSPPLEESSGLAANTGLPTDPGADTSAPNAFATNTALNSSVMVAAAAAVGNMLLNNYSTDSPHHPYVTPHLPPHRHHYSFSAPAQSDPASHGYQYPPYASPCDAQEDCCEYLSSSSALYPSHCDYGCSGNYSHCDEREYVFESLYKPEQGEILECIAADCDDCDQSLLDSVSQQVLTGGGRR